MKIYTKTGDKGETGLLGNVRVSKSHHAIEACGALDETNSFLGLARAEGLPAKADALLTRLQHDLFDLGGRVAACLGSTNKVPEFPALRVSELESTIDDYQSELPPLSSFILPGGSRAGSTLHVARAVCRRAERSLVALMELELKTDLTNEVIYLNRLGDLLFVLSRFVNVEKGCTETEWNVGRRNSNG